MLTSHLPQYKDPEVVQKIKEATKNTIHIGLDTISEANTLALSMEVFGEGPGKLVVILPVRPKAQAREDIEILRKPFVLVSEFYQGSPY